MELNEETVQLIRDVKSEFAPLEKFFGLLTQGMSFGETCLLNHNEEIPKFYHTVAMCNTELL